MQWEFRPGNPKVVHHAAMKNRSHAILTGNWMRANPVPVFAGMNLPETTETPNGHFLNWQPGQAALSRARLAWVGNWKPIRILFLQLHLHPPAGPRRCDSEVGFYFTDRAPTNSLFKIALDWPAIDIPAGENQLRD